MDDKAMPAKRAWSTPMLRRYDLTEEEQDQLRKSADPIRELLVMKPELTKNRSS